MLDNNHDSDINGPALSIIYYSLAGFVLMAAAWFFWG
jgi:hypothetical protein